MKRLIICILILFLSGCSLGKDILTDSQFTQYQQGLDNLEHEYHQNKISYVEYQQKKKDLEGNYDRTIKIRENSLK